MPQFYFLSIVANAFAGLLLAADYLGQKVPFFAEWRKLLANRTFEITLGVAVASTGVLKLIILSPREYAPVVGDLLPALAGILLGAVLLGEVLFNRTGHGGEKVKRAARIAIGYRVPIGIAGLIVAALHFVVPGVLFL
jgi:hypothetical protein